MARKLRYFSGRWTGHGDISVAAFSEAAACRALLPYRVTTYEFKTYWSETGNAETLSALRAYPEGTVLHRDSRRCNACTRSFPQFKTADQQQILERDRYLAPRELRELVAVSSDARIAVSRILKMTADTDTLERFRKLLELALGEPV